MALKQNSFEGGTNTTTVTTGNSGGASGTAFDAVTLNTGTIIFSNTQVMHGALSCYLTSPGSALTTVAYTGYAASSMVARFYVNFDTLPGTNGGGLRIADVRTSTVSVARVIVSTGNVLIFQTNNGSTTLKTFTSALSANTWYRVEIACQNGTAGTSIFKMDYYLGDSATPVETGYSSTTVNSGTTANITQASYGFASTAAGAVSVYLDDIAMVDATTTYLGPALVPPTAVFTATPIGMDGVFDASGSSATNPATISSYAWTFGDTGTGTGVNPTHVYTAAGTYTVGLTVTDSNTLTGTVSHSITITAPGTQADPSSVTTSTGLASNSGSVLNSITDKSSGAPVLTTFSSGGSGSVLRGAVGPISPPQSGQPFLAILAVDRVSSASGSISAKLYEKDGTTLRSTVTATIPDMAASGGNGSQIGTSAIVQVAWPWVDVQSVVDWNQLVYEFTFTVS